MTGTRRDSTAECIAGLIQPVASEHEREGPDHTHAPIHGLSQPTRISQSKQRETDAELERLQARAKELEEALRNIAKGEGRYSRDALTFAENTIDNMKKLATDALAPRGDDEPTEAMKRAAQTHPVMFGSTHSDNRLRPLWYLQKDVDKECQRFMESIRAAFAMAREGNFPDGLNFSPTAWGLDRVCDAAVYAALERAGFPMLVCKCGADPLADGVRQLHEFGCPALAALAPQAAPDAGATGSTVGGAE